MANAPYREFWKPRTNLPQDRRILGTFGLTANGTAITLSSFVRPSQGLSAGPGIGSMFTVTQPTTAPTFLVVFNEQQLRPVFVDVCLNYVPTAPGSNTTANGATTVTYPAQPTFTASSLTGSAYTVIATAIDVPSNSFYVSLCDYTGATAAATDQPLSGYTWQIGFEAIQIPTFSPASL
jgi:hypothetical protein